MSSGPPTDEAFESLLEDLQNLIDDYVSPADRIGDPLDRVGTHLTEMHESDTLPVDFAGVRGVLKDARIPREDRARICNRLRRKYPWLENSD